MGLFNLFKKEEKDEKVTVIDPEMDKLREEKFNIPVIEDEEDEVPPSPAPIKPRPATNNLPDYNQAKNNPAYNTPYSLYKSREIISPMTGRTEKVVIEEPVKQKPGKKKIQFSDEDALIPVISPMFGNRPQVIEPEIKPAKEPEKKPVKEPEVVPAPVKKVEKKEPKPAPQPISFDSPKQRKRKQEAAKKAEETEIEAAIVEQTTGEYHFDFPQEKKPEQEIMTEISDEMTLDELLTLYEKKK